MKLLSPLADLPSELSAVARLALNLRYCWHHPTRKLLSRIHPGENELGYLNPVELLLDMKPERASALTRDSEFLAEAEKLAKSLDDYVSAAPDNTEYSEFSAPVAYFSAEYGLDTPLRMYSGGLGVLAGDHLRSASDLGLPLVAVGLFYRSGYFRQVIEGDGTQSALERQLNPARLPIRLVAGDDGGPLILEFKLDVEDVRSQIWRVDVGRVPLFLLDTNLNENSERSRNICSRLYPDNRELRLRQEILLGIGGARALVKLGITPSVFHINEGHSALLIYERIRALIAESGMDFERAEQEIRRTTVFTAHTPVASGHEVYDPELLGKYLRGFVERLGVEWEEWLSDGRFDQGDYSEWFSLSVAALRRCGAANGVSRLHGRVSRSIWGALWPGLSEKEVPIGSVTNGASLTYWIAPRKAALFESRLGQSLADSPGDAESWRAVENIPVGAFWNAQRSCKKALIEYVYHRRSTSAASESGNSKSLDPEAFTIGFARRFTAYKRGALIFGDPERLARILGDPERPAQIVLAGKAHPADEEGQGIIRDIVRLAEDSRFIGRVVFVPDYDMSLARYLVSGCDLWLNNPLRPQEASGTSGMKAALNGAQSLSTLDGWWDEAFNRNIGWKIGAGADSDGSAEADTRDRDEIYDLLENEIIPLYYSRDADNVPSEWIGRALRSVSSVACGFSAQRMVRDYARRYYLPACSGSQATQPAG